MKLYRALDRLSIGVVRYGVFPENATSARAIRALLYRGKIVEVITPPLDVVFPWRVDELNAQGIHTIEELFDSDLSALKDEALALFQPEHCANCRG